MPRTTAFASLLIASIISLWSETACGELPPKRFVVTAFNKITYGSGAVRKPRVGQKKLVMDLFAPNEKGQGTLHPAMVVMHGGGFSKGDRRNNNVVELCQDFAARGIVCATIDYRMEGDDPPPPKTNGAAKAPEAAKAARLRAIAAAIEDAAEAVTFLHQNSKRFAIDRDRICVGGFSAGAVTALSLAYGKRGTDLPIMAVLSFAGSLGQRASIIDKNGPALFVAHGTNDERLPLKEAEEMVARALQVGIPCKFFRVEGAGHALSLDQHVEEASIYERAAAFIFEAKSRAEQSKPPEERS